MGASGVVFGFLVVTLFGLRWRMATHAEAGYKILQTSDEEIRFAIAFEQRIDRSVFAVNLLAQKIALVFRLLDFPLQALDITRRVVLLCRGLSWLVGRCRIELVLCRLVGL